MVLVRGSGFSEVTMVVDLLVELSGTAMLPAAAAAAVVGDEGVNVDSIVLVALVVCNDLSLASNASTSLGVNA